MGIVHNRNNYNHHRFSTTPTSARYKKSLKSRKCTRIHSNVATKLTTRSKNILRSLGYKLL